VLNAQTEGAEKTAKRQAAARRRVARQPASRLEAAAREVERLQQEKKHDRKQFVARASGTDPDAHVIRNGQGGTVPSYNVQLLTDTRHGIVVNVLAFIDAIDYRQLGPAIERCETMLGRKPKQSGRWRLHQPRVGASGRSWWRRLLWIVARRLEADGPRCARPQGGVLGQRVSLRCQAGLLHLSRRTDPVASGSAESRAPHCPLRGQCARSQRGPNGGGRLPASKNRQQRWPSKPR
jgi:hypothetical protein